MANRVIVGKRGSKHGVFVSKSGVDATASSSTTPLSFDSNAANGLNVHSFGQGVLVPSQPESLSFAFGGTTYTADEIDITHSLGYIPAYAVRWTTLGNISSGLATKVWTPHYFEDVVERDEADGDDEEDIVTFTGTSGCSAYAHSNNVIRIRNEMGNPDHTVNGVNNNLSMVFYSYVIFHTENFKNGESL